MLEWAGVVLNPTLIQVRPSAKNGQVRRDLITSTKQKCVNIGKQASNDHDIFTDTYN